MRKLGLFTVLVGLVALAGCNPKSTSGTAATSVSPPVALVNGAPISREFFEFYIKGATRGKTSADLSVAEREVALDNLIRAQLVAQIADKEGITSDPDTKNLIELQRLNVLQQRVEEHYLKGVKPTDQELRAEYQTQVAQMAHTEYHVRHIMLADEPSAEKIVDRLNKGEKFADLAKTESIDTSNKQNGGDLGWVTPDRAQAGLGKAFVDALSALKPGEYTHTPVQSSYGWHVIYLEGTRDRPPPPYDESVQQQLVRIVEDKKFKAYVDGLMKDAMIDRKL